jgi:superoxide dismutase, Fe-Mn family
MKRALPAARRLAAPARADVRPQRRPSSRWAIGNSRSEPDFDTEGGLKMAWTDLKPRRFAAFDRDLDGISKQTMEDHYKLYEGYAKKANECRKILNEFDYAEIEGNQVYSPLRAVSIDYTFALLGFKNHDLYFGHLGGEGGPPTGRFADLLEDEFKPGGVEGWLDALKKGASAARGWVMVGYDLNDGSLFNYLMDTQNLWAVYNMCPVLALDVYEHAYVRDFGATPDGRKQYVEAFLRNVDWDHVNRQLAQAQAAKGGADATGLREAAPVAG